jgi:molybdopterin converting factor small subunit
VVRVRMFAVVREAAGVAEVEVPAGRLGDILAGLQVRFGERFSKAVSTASVLVDGARCGDMDAEVRDGVEVALLPPFSGGSR